MTKDISDNRIGLGAISALLGVLFFSINDAAIKFLSGDYALHQIVLIRSIIAIILLLVVIVPLDGGFRVLRTRRLGMHVLRGFCVVFANMTFFLGLSLMPLAEAVAVFFISPLLITALSVLILGEKAGPRRWGAVVAGLIGVLIMLRPGAAGFQVALLFPLAAALGYAFLHILTRRIGGTESAATMSVYIQITFIFVSGAIGLGLGNGQLSGQGGEMFEFVLRGWIWPDSGDYPLLVLLGICSALGGFFISQAYRISEASVIAPLEYAAMPMAILLGLLVFGEWPDLVAWAGMILIVGAGVFVAWREGRASRPQPSFPRTRR
ncbi:EamA domain-containing membrane protein RarD [Salinihabitans flavidus]|uniref:EamA domain-containing membrane protein RarD n=1 Tax=Salinihabitans flavidus TaxID=569882 RepID=A0A1H8LGN3_9RHOB|nr:DMT family transporter [Salinihabitans flavidus]SEO04331.1 EamA domain-containing membrane protein RarD [Salinihabitans flavidus]